MFAFSGMPARRCYVKERLTATEVLHLMRKIVPSKLGLRSKLGLGLHNLIPLANPAATHISHSQLQVKSLRYTELFV